MLENKSKRFGPSALTDDPTLADDFAAAGLLTTEFPPVTAQQMAVVANIEITRELELPDNLSDSVTRAPAGPERWSGGDSETRPIHRRGVHDDASQHGVDAIARRSTHRNDLLHGRDAIIAPPFATEDSLGPPMQPAFASTRPPARRQMTQALHATLQTLGPRRVLAAGGAALLLGLFFALHGSPANKPTISENAPTAPSILQPTTTPPTRPAPTTTPHVSRTHASQRGRHHGRH